EMTRLTKEIIWILGTMFIAFIIGLLCFGDTLFNGRPLDLQIHDTYYIFPKTFYLIIIWITIILATYIIRGLYRKSNNRLVNIIITVILTLILLTILPYYNWVYGYTKDSGYYFHNQDGQTDRISDFVITHWYLTVLIGLIGLTIATIVYKTFRPVRTN